MDRIALRQLELLAEQLDREVAQAGMAMLQDIAIRDRTNLVLELNPDAADDNLILSQGDVRPAPFADDPVADRQFTVGDQPHDEVAFGQISAPRQFADPELPGRLPQDQPLAIAKAQQTRLSLLVKAGLAAELDQLPLQHLVSERRLARQAPGAGPSRLDVSRGVATSDTMARMTPDKA